MNHEVKDISGGVLVVVIAFLVANAGWLAFWFGGWVALGYVLQATLAGAVGWAGYVLYPDVKRAVWDGWHWLIDEWQYQRLMRGWSLRRKRSAYRENTRKRWIA